MKNVPVPVEEEHYKVPYVPDLLPCNDDMELLSARLSLSEYEIRQIVVATTGQRSCVQWHRARFGRITGSIVGEVIKWAVRTK